MNYGFVPPVGEQLVLKSDDEADRLCAQLYERVTGSVDLAGARVLEVGSGRGGGASYLARYRRPASVAGVDFSRDAVAFCRQRHGGVLNLSFEVGDAENLSFADGAFDAVANVESSHCYGNVARFFGEAARVLREGGHFLFTDLRVPAEMEELRRLLEETPGFKIVVEEDITAGVAAALAADDARKRSMIEALIPAKIRRLFQEFAGVKGGQIYERLTKRELVYFRFVVRKMEG